MEEAIEQALFGESKATNPRILSLELSLPIAAVRKTLEKFYNKHSDRLSAAYTICGKLEGERVVRVIEANSLKTELTRYQDATVTLYVVSPKNATDHTVLAEVSREWQTKSREISLKQLEDTGSIVNPVLDGFVPANPVVNSEVHSEAKSTVPQSKSVPLAKTEPSKACESNSKSPKVELKSNSLKEPAREDVTPPAKANASVIGTKEATKNTKAQKVSSKPTAPAAKKSAGVSSFFKKGTREDAVKLGKREQPLKASASIVEAEDDAADEPADLRPSSKKQQLENLKGMFDDYEGSAPPDDGEEDQGIDVYTGKDIGATPGGESIHKDTKGVSHAANEEIVMDLGGDESDDATASQPAAQREQSEPMEVDPEPANVPSPVASEPELSSMPLSSNPNEASDNKPGHFQTTVDEDGWEVDEYVAPANTSKPVSKPSAVPANPPAARKSSDKPLAPLNLPKIPAKPGNKQKTLTSFFMKK